MRFGTVGSGEWLIALGRAASIPPCAIPHDYVRFRLPPAHLDDHIVAILCARCGREPVEELLNRPVVNIGPVGQIDALDRLGAPRIQDIRIGRIRS